MDEFFSRQMDGEALGKTKMQAVFDAEAGTPELIDAIAAELPQIRDVMASLRNSLPLAPHSGVGPIGRSGFYRIPNHYRSVCFVLPPRAANEPSPGVIVFKGTEPLIADFPTYFDWMLGAPFRGSPLPLALHFPLDMKLPPAAMWIEECVAEQKVTSTVQQLFFKRHGRLARLPVPLFVFKMTPQQVARYEEVILTGVPADGMKKIRNKLIDGLGVEVYYYPELPVRAADLFVGNAREALKASLGTEQVEDTFRKWIKLLAEVLCLDYMPFAPWHHGMGGCVDPGNACIDGGFNDLLTLVPFDTILTDALFRRSLMATIQMLGESMVAMSAASVGVPAAAESDASALAASYITEGLRHHIGAAAQQGLEIDPRLTSFFNAPEAADIARILRESHQGRARPAQFAANPGPQSRPMSPQLRSMNGAPFMATNP